MLQVDLKVLEGKQQGKLIPLNVKQFLIGREQDCHLRPNSDLVSRHHCVFTIDDFTIRLRDLGSTNGTFVNGERIQGQIVLKPGDHVVVGKLSFEIIVRQTAAVAVAAGKGKADGDSSSSIFTGGEPARPPASMDTSVNVTDTIEIPALTPTDDTSIMPSFPSSPESATQQIPVPQGYVPTPAYLAPVPGYAMPPGYGMPPGYFAPGYPPGYMPPGYGMPGYMPQPGYGMSQQMLPGAPSYAPAPPATAPGTTLPDVPEVILPDPESTGAKPVEAPPPAPVAAEGEAGAASPPKNPSDAAADIIRAHRTRR
jgi:predicted component of type VI protein secretion system